MGAEALKAMEKVASHINEMQKIYEDYGSVFDQLVAEQTGQDKEVDFTVTFLITGHGKHRVGSMKLIARTELRTTPATIYKCGIPQCGPLHSCNLSAHQSGAL